MKTFSLLGLFLASSASLFAQTVVSPFTGLYSEGFESYSTPAGYVSVSNGTEIMDGFATISADVEMYVFTNNIWGLGGAPDAQPWDGTKAFGINGTTRTLTIIFDEDVDRFGGYWVQNNGSPDVSISFYDVSDQLIGTTTFYAGPGAGNPTWSGWELATAAKRVTVTGNFLVADGLQAASVPEPATAGLLALGSCVVLFGWRKRQ